MKKTFNISQGVRINNYSRFHNNEQIHMEQSEQCVSTNLDLEHVSPDLDQEHVSPDLDLEHVSPDLKL